MSVVILIFFIFISIIYLISRLTCAITRSSSCLIGKTALITGANSGIGYQTALNLASRGCRIIMAGRSDMEAAKGSIIKHTSNTNIVTKKLDLTSFKSVRNFAKNILETEERLDILINNAGTGEIPLELTEDGLNQLMQTNYFGHFLLTHLLVPLLKQTGSARIIFNSSLMAFVHNSKMDDFNFDYEKEGSWYQKFAYYGTSKLALIIASDIFSQKLKPFGITSNSIHPGLVSTDFFAKSNALSYHYIVNNIIKGLNKIYSKDAWEGSQTLVHVAVSKKLKNVTGKFFCDCRSIPKPLLAYNKYFCNNFWKKSEEIVQLGHTEKL